MSRAAALLLALAAAACTPSPEEQVLTRFFEASRALDSTLLYRLATVVFNPRTDGSIQTFAITTPGPEQHGPLTAAQQEEARRSLAASTGQEPNLSGFAVDLLRRELRLTAAIRSPGGVTMPAALVVSMARAVARRDNATIEGQWIVTRLQRARAERTSRGASSAPQS